MENAPEYSSAFSICMASMKANHLIPEDQEEYYIPFEQMLTGLPARFQDASVKIAVLAHTARSTRATLPKQESHLAGWLN